MPNRIIKESTFTSDRISSLSDFEFRLWVGLITQADDAGRGDARPAIIRGRVFPLRDKVTVKEIQNALDALAAGGCICLYEVDGKPYFYFPSWSEHQRVRNAIPKFPDPDGGAAIPIRRESPQVAANGGERTRSAAQSNPIQSESNPNPILNKGADRADRTPLEIALDDFAAARKAMKKTLTPRGRELTLRELERLAPNDPEMQIAILNQSIQRGWQGVFPLKTDDRPKGKGPAMKTSYDGIRIPQGDDTDRLAERLGVAK